MHRDVPPMRNNHVENIVGVFVIKPNLPRNKNSKWKNTLSMTNIHHVWVACIRVFIIIDLGILSNRSTWHKEDYGSNRELCKTILKKKIPFLKSN